MVQREILVSIYEIRGDISFKICLGVRLSMDCNELNMFSIMYTVVMAYVYFTFCGLPKCEKITESFQQIFCFMQNFL